jgi:hypothetical protein
MLVPQKALKNQVFAIVEISLYFAFTNELNVAKKDKKVLMND